MGDLARANGEPDGQMRRALNQAARELLLAQSSDWAFIMKIGAEAPYARRRTTEHLRRFRRLYDEIRGGGIDEDYLSHLESLDNIFPRIDYSVYA